MIPLAGSLFSGFRMNPPKGGLAFPNALPLQWRPMESAFTGAMNEVLARTLHVVGVPRCLRRASNRKCIGWTCILT